MNLEDKILQIPIEETISKYVKLKRFGSGLKACCPFHNENTPSFNVSNSKGIYKCFGCGEGGNAIKFVMKYENMTFPEALKHLAEMHGLEYVDYKPKNDAERAAELRQESMRILLEDATRIFHSKLGHQDAITFLEDRGISPVTAEIFQLGYCPTGYSFHDLHYDADLLRETQLEFDRGCRFQGRFIFPIHDYAGAGKPIAFAGRTFSKSKEVAKYINSGTYSLYNKSQVLYNLNRSKDHIRKAGFAILTEGYMDVITLWQADVKNTVAASGTAFTAEQAKLLSRFTKEITVLFDGDSAGIKAFRKSLEVLIPQEFRVKVVTLPDGMDPDEYTQEYGAEQIREYLTTQSVDILDKLLSDLQNPYDIALQVDEILDLVKLMTNPLLQNVYLDELNRITNLNYSIIEKQLYK